MRIVCLSDTHNRTDGLVVPEGDLLLHAGDLTGQGSEEEVARAARWLARLPHPAKVVVAGNHDFLFQRDPAKARAILARVPGLTYLEDTGAVVAGLSIHGSPWQPWFYDWAFNLERDGEELARVWAQVPAGVDVLLTHSPPNGILDRTLDGRAVGCERLAAALERIRPRLHVFGHIHEAAGSLTIGATQFVNASVLDAHYRPGAAPVVVELEAGRRG